jgi:two-component system, cell cycle response regulator
MTPAVLGRARAGGEVASLAERLAYMQWLRLGFAAVAMGATALVLALSADLAHQVLVTTFAYLGLVAAAEALRRTVPRSSLHVLAAMLLVDGTYLAWTTYLTGGVDSPLRVLIYLHLVSVTLLASYRTGLKIALWDSLLRIVTLYAEAARLIKPVDLETAIGPGTQSVITPLAVFNVTSLWLVALVTAAFSALNERELRRRKDDSEGLASMATQLEGVSRAEHVAETLLDHIGRHYGFFRSVVILTKTQPAVLASRGAEHHAFPSGAQLDRVARTVEARRAPALLKVLDPNVDPCLAALLPGARGVLVAPLIAEGRLLGVVAVEQSKRARQIERRVVNMVNQFSAYAALALDNALLLQQVQRMADTDALTGVGNRRLFERTLEREIAHAQIKGEQLSLLLVDVDHFKAFNDSLGHQAGDQALREVASVLVRRCGKQDTVARYGGEEFAVVVPGADVERSLELAEELRLAVSTAHGAKPVTASVGVATYPQDAPDSSTLVRSADRALYEAKRQGRNRVCRPAGSELERLPSRPQLESDSFASTPGTA